MQELELETPVVRLERLIIERAKLNNEMTEIVEEQIAPIKNSIAAIDSTIETLLKTIGLKEYKGKGFNVRLKEKQVYTVSDLKLAINWLVDNPEFCKKDILNSRTLDSYIKEGGSLDGVPIESQVIERISFTKNNK